MSHLCSCFLKVSRLKKFEKCLFFELDTRSGMWTVNFVYEIAFIPIWLSFPSFLSLLVQSAQDHLLYDYWMYVRFLLCLELFFSVRKKSDPLEPTSFDPRTSRIQILNATTEPQNLLGLCGLKLLVVSEVCLGTYVLHCEKRNWCVSSLGSPISSQVKGYFLWLQ